MPPCAHPLGGTKVKVRGHSKNIFPAVTSAPPLLKPFRRLWAYVSPVRDLIESFDISYHQFADNTQLLVAMNVNDATPALERLANCLAAVRSWFLRGSIKDIRWRRQCRRRGWDLLNALEAGGAVWPSVLSLISSAPAKKNELSHYASTAQLLKCGKAIHWNKSTTQNGLETTKIVSFMQL